MKLKDFTRKMRKPIFTWEEAKRIAWNTSPNVLQLDLHNWRKQGDILSLRRGVYCFSGHSFHKSDIARHMYPPCYISLEWALHEHGLLPDAVFGLTLITTRGTRRFLTPQGEFIYHKVKKSAFFGYDPETLLALPEKALVDYLYLHSGQLVPDNKFWDEMRWQNLDTLDFGRAGEFSRKVGVRKVTRLLESLQKYAKT